MGSEAACTLRLDGRTTRGTALLEQRELIFRGAFRLAICLRGDSVGPRGRPVARDPVWREDRDVRIGPTGGEVGRENSQSTVTSR